MYYYYPFPPPPPPVHPYYYPYQQISRQYPAVDIKMFMKSIKSYRLLMHEGSHLLDRLGDADFDVKLMTAAQQGNKAEVDKLIKSIGLKVPVETKYTPSGITFELSAPDPESQLQCCTLIVHMKWGN